MDLDNLTQLQKAAIEGEVAKAYSTARHDSEVLYRLYTILKNAPQDILPYVVGITKDIVGIKEELLDKVVLETKVDEPPMWLWINKTVADIKLSLKLAMADSMINDAEVDKKEVQQRIIKSAFVVFIRKTAMVCTKAARALCRHIIDEEPIELGFLEDICFSLIPEIDELEPTEVMTDTVFHTEFDIRSMMSFRIETEVIEKRTRAEEIERDIQQQSTDIADKLDKVEEFVPIKLEELEKILLEEEAKESKARSNDDLMSKAVDNVLTQLLNERLSKPKEEKAKYAVTKEYKNSVSTTLKTFATEAEAESYKEKIEKDYPELMKSCKLKVKKGK